MSHFLKHAERVNSERTHKWYKTNLKSFHQFVGEIKALDIRPYHVDNWIADRYPNTKNGSTLAHAMRPVVRVLNRAQKTGRIDRPPLQGMSLPKVTTRDIDLSPEQYAKLLTLAKHQTIRDAVETMWHTGCRPQELQAVEARHVGDRCWQFSASESKGGIARTILLRHNAQADLPRLPSPGQGEAARLDHTDGVKLRRSCQIK